MPLLSARPAVTFPAEERHCPSVGTKLYCLVTEAHACEQLAQGCYLEADRLRFEPATFWIASECSTIKPHGPHNKLVSERLLIVVLFCCTIEVESCLISLYCSKAMMQVCCLVYLPKPS